MIVQNLIKIWFAKIFIFLNRFKIVWTKDDLLEEIPLSLNPKSVSDDYVKEIILKNKLLLGWYVLEIKAKSTRPIITCRINLHTARKKIGDLNFEFFIRSNCTFKWIFLSLSSGSVRISCDSSDNDFELEFFRLSRVSEKFARSRIITKLQALHPQYKLSFSEQKRNGTPDPLITKLTVLPILWADYCKVFEVSREAMQYPQWVKKFDTHHKVCLKRIGQYIATFENRPVISIVMPVYNPDLHWLDAAVKSVTSQFYPHWELCIADDASTDAKVRTVLTQYMRDDIRIKVIFREENGHISAASNSALEIATGNWIALLDQDDLLSNDALFWIVDAINKYPSCLLIYSDEDKIDANGVRSDAYFKSDWNPDLFYSQNMFSHLGVYSTILLRSVGGFRVGLEGSQDYDLALRCIEKIQCNQVHHIPRILYHWRMHLNSTSYNSDAKPYATTAAQRALSEHFHRKSIDAKVESLDYGYRVKYNISVSPLVTLIIPTRNHVKLIKQCISSILEKTTYPNYEIIIINNGSDELGTLRYLENIANGLKIRVVHDPQPFNYSALNNAGVKLARGEIIGLINNDVEVISPNWLDEMVSHAVRLEVGAVGARLWYAGDTLQHAGVVLGIHGVAGHVHRFLSRGNVGYCGRASLIQSFSAVTGACLLVRKSVYEEIGGLNESDLQVAGNDIDFCLRLREAGYRNIFTPFAELYHHESASRGFDDTPEKQARSAKEVAYMKQRWGNALLNDPAYNPNLTLDSEDFGLAWPPRVPRLDDVLSAMERARQAPTSLTPPTLQ